jgi:SAM-dependent methyltransferase
VVDDFAREFYVPEGPTGLLDGMLFANSLHFVHDPAAVLARMVGWLRPGGRVVLVEYDQREASQWVPYPISTGSLPALARAAGLTQPRLTGSRPSEYRGILYAVAMDKSA